MTGILASWTASWNGGSGDVTLFRTSGFTFVESCIQCTMSPKRIRKLRTCPQSISITTLLLLWIPRSLLQCCRFCAMASATLPVRMNTAGPPIRPSNKHARKWRTCSAREAHEIVFTGGGSEASNLVLKGVVFKKLRGSFGRGANDAHIVTCAVEHPATLQPCEFLRRLGCKITILPVDQYGLVDPAAARKAITGSTTLVSVMHANNEVGTMQPIREIAAIAKERGVLVHTDAAQSLGKVAINVQDLGVDLLTMAGHKLYAPKGIGVLYVRKGVQLEPLIHGAGHESGRRAGTENVPYIVGLGKACELARQSLPEATQRLQELRDRLWKRLQDGLGSRVVLNGHPILRLPNTLNVNFVGHVGSELLERLPGIAASIGSACHEGQVTLSPVLRAMGVPPEIGRVR